MGPSGDRILPKAGLSNPERANAIERNSRITSGNGQSI